MPEINSTFLAASGNLMGYWRLENNAEDASSNSYDLTTSSAPDYVGGVFGYGADFEASSSEYLSIATTSAGNLNITGNQTWMCWVRVESLGNYGVACIQNAADSAAKGLKFNSSGEIRFQCTGLSTNTAVTSATILSTGTWYHVAGRYNGSALDIFVDGVKTTAIASGTPSNITDGAFSIGSVRAVTEYFDGIIEDVAVFNTALTDAQIVEIFTASRPKVIWLS